MNKKYKLIKNKLIFESLKRFYEAIRYFPTFEFFKY